MAGLQQAADKVPEGYFHSWGRGRLTLRSVRSNPKLGFPAYSTKAVFFWNPENIQL